LAITVEREIGGRKVVIETGRLAKQAAGAALVRCEDTVVFAAVADASPREGIDFFPLTVDYREKAFSAGKIFGGRFYKREGRPTEKEILTMRLIDRPTRPLFPEGFIRDILITAMTLSADGDHDPDVYAMIAGSAALAVSRLPFLGPFGAVRIGRVGGEFVVNPTYAQRQEGDLDLVVAGTADSIVMVEAGAKEVPEDVMVAALEKAGGICRELALLQKELAEKVGLEKLAVEPPDKSLLEQLMPKYIDAVAGACEVSGKMERKEALKAVCAGAVEELVNDEDPNAPTKAQIRKVFDEIQKVAMRKAIVEKGRRCDGRDPKQVRPISCEVGLLPRVHGSSVFTRGETQALVTTTLGTAGDKQMVEALHDDFEMDFLLHYSFPSFCVGEVKMPRGPSRREIGHGLLAKRALDPVIPKDDTWPYTIRITSDVMESNGSSSMATVCGGALSMMDAGIPVKAPVAGIAMGLIHEGGDYVVLTDILGDEDHFGDMDFKVAGSAEGITALQMDIKLKEGLSADLLKRALEQAREGRLHILGEMAKALPAPRADINPLAPKIITVKINPEKIGKVIGPGGSTIRGIEEQTGAELNIDDDGIVSIAGETAEEAEAGRAMVEALVADPEVGKVYKGRVKGIKDFGAFVEIMPGTEGLLHISEYDHGYVKHIGDHLEMGDEVEVKLIEVDERSGKLRLSRKVLIEPPPDAEKAPEGEGGRRPSGGDRGGRRDRGGRGGRSGGRDGRRGGGNRDRGNR
jgi:polyribonucleotide nucleotidyltransferase